MKLTPEEREFLFSPNAEEPELKCRSSEAFIRMS